MELGFGKGRKFVTIEDKHQQVAVYLMNRRCGISGEWKMRDMMRDIQ